MRADEASLMAVWRLVALRLAGDDDGAAMVLHGLDAEELRMVVSVQADALARLLVAALCCGHHDRFDMIIDDHPVTVRSLLAGLRATLAERADAAAVHQNGHYGVPRTGQTDPP
jgi:hypothetical protein